MPGQPMMGAGSMAGGGGGMPPPQGGGGPAPLVAGGSAVSTKITEIMDQLKQILPQVVDAKGYVDMNKLITLWPQFSRVPFQIVMQLIQQSPEMLGELISQFGLNGIIANGKVISAEELAQLGGASGRGAVA